MLSLVRFQNLSEDILSSVAYSETIVTKNAKKARLELCSNKKNYAQLQRFLLENAFNRKLSACAVKLVLLINSTLFWDQGKMCVVGQKSAPTIFRFSAPAPAPAPAPASDSEPGPFKLFEMIRIRLCHMRLCQLACNVATGSQSAE